MPQSCSKGVLFVTLGSPENPFSSGIRSYLKEFLSDPRVLSIPSIFRFLLLYGIILPFRVPKVSKHYQEIWTRDGSPQIQNSQNFFHAIKKEFPDDFQCQIAFQYGTPSIQDSLDLLLQTNIQELCVIPLFPQYTSAVTGSIIETVIKTAERKPVIPKLQLIDHFFDQDFYVKSLAKKLQKALSLAPAYDCIVFSYHGIPLSHLKNTQLSDKLNDGEKKSRKGEQAECDYVSQCQQTTQRIMAYLGKTDQDVITSFQSKYGKGKWVPPYTNEILMELAEKRKKVFVVCPSFTFDCLETLYEIDIQEKESFLKKGGRTLDRLPCLNNDSVWVKKFANYIQSKFCK